MPRATRDPHARALLRAAGPDAGAAIADVVLGATPELLTDLRVAVATADIRTIRVLKQDMRGSSAIVGAMALMALCDSFSVETDRSLWLDAVETEYARVVEALEQEAGLVTI